MAGHDGRDRVLVDELRMAVAAQQHAEIIEPGDDSLQLHAIDQKDGERRLVLADVIEKGVLEVLRTFRGHGFLIRLFVVARRSARSSCALRPVRERSSTKTCAPNMA
eukprot:TRINITY_DN18264_c0_g1_i1.p2 TRINITY_DN18264_c0_g1~~TRINITY_DN18264_c0_g1_i1.p2  ORF type:complete len:107 (-),score=14.74 TRINITY_DN18264_c0_g1_i1:85-405(-)